MAVHHHFAICKCILVYAIKEQILLLLKNLQYVWTEIICWAYH